MGVHDMRELWRTRERWLFQPPRIPAEKKLDFWPHQQKEVLSMKPYLWAVALLLPILAQCAQADSVSNINLTTIAVDVFT